MNEFIEKIVELDEMTSSLKEEYRLKEQELRQSFNKSKTKFEKELEEKFDDRVRTFEKQVKSDYNSKEKEIKSNLDKKLNLIMERYSLEKPGIIDYLTKMVLEGDFKDGRG